MSESRYALNVNCYIQHRLENSLIFLEENKYRFHFGYLNQHLNMRAEYKEAETLILIQLE